MQGLVRAARLCGEHLHITKHDYSAGGSILKLIKQCSHQESISSPTKHRKVLSEARFARSHSMPEKVLQNTTGAQVLATKGKIRLDLGSGVEWMTLCMMLSSNETTQMAQIGSLVILKPGKEQHIAGILTERGYLHKVIVRDRSSKYTKVGEIMTDQNKLLTVTSDTNILHAMQLMTGNETEILHRPL